MNNIHVCAAGDCRWSAVGTVYFTFDPHAVTGCEAAAAPLSAPRASAAKLDDLNEDRSETTARIFSVFN